MICCSLFSVGVISLTAVYAGFVVALEFLAPKCQEEPCSSEGVDTATVGWATELFIVGAMVFFALHLALSTLLVRRSGILAQIFMGGGFSLSVIAKVMYGNNGTGDGKGMVGYWVLVWVAYSFLTLSMLSHGTLATETSDALILFQKPCCADRLLWLFQGLVILAYISVLTGCIWCATSSGLHVDETIDDFEDYADNTPACIQIVEISQLVWMVCYALFWIPAAQLLRAATRRNPQSMHGIYSPDAASCIIVLQYTIGPIYVVYLRLAAVISDREPLEVYQDAYGAIISHFGMLMTFYFAYHLSMALSLKSKKVMPQSSLSQEIEESKQELAEQRKKTTAFESSVLSQEIEKGKQELEMRKKTIRFEDDVEKAEKSKAESSAV
jgi:hypothetical protein